MSIIEDSYTALTAAITALENDLDNYEGKVGTYRQTDSERNRDRVERSCQCVLVSYSNVADITRELYVQHTWLASGPATLNEALRRSNEVTTILENARNRVASTEDIWPGAAFELKAWLEYHQETISSLTAVINQTPAGRHYMLPATGGPGQQTSMGPYYTQYQGGQNVNYTYPGTQYTVAQPAQQGYVIGGAPDDDEYSQQRPQQDQHQQQQQQ